MWLLCLWDLCLELPYTMYDYSMFMYNDFFMPGYDAKFKFKQTYEN